MNPFSTDLADMIKHFLLILMKTAQSRQLQSTVQKRSIKMNTDIVLQLKQAYEELNEDDRVRALVLTGASDKAFAAGADIKEMLSMDYHEMESHDRSKSLLQMGTLLLRNHSWSG